MKIKCLPSWDAKAGTPSMMTPFPGAKAILTHCVGADLFCWNIEGMYLWLVWCYLFWQDVKLCWNRASLEQFLRVIWEAGFRAIVLSLAEIKLLSVYSYYRLLTDYFRRQYHSTRTGKPTWGEKIQHLYECCSSAAFLKTLMWSGRTPQRRWDSSGTSKDDETWISGEARRRCQRLQKWFTLRCGVKCIWGVMVKYWRGSALLENKFSGEGMPDKTRNF